MVFGVWCISHGMKKLFAATLAVITASGCVASTTTPDTDDDPPPSSGRVPSLKPYAEEADAGAHKNNPPGAAEDMDTRAFPYPDPPTGIVLDADRAAAPSR
jgi:hypothetical protein